MATYDLSRRGQSQKNAVNVQDYGNYVLGQLRGMAGRQYATRNDYQLSCLLHNSKEALRSNLKQKLGRHLRSFAPPR